MVMATFLSLALVGLLAYQVSAAAAGDALPSKSEVRAVMKLVGNFAQQRYATNVEAYWDDGVYHIGRMVLYDVTKNAAHLAPTEGFGEYNDWILDRGVIAANRHNRLAAAQSWLAAYGVSPTASIDGIRVEISDQTSLSLATVTNGAYF